MQQYSNITNCIRMCERMLSNNERFLNNDEKPLGVHYSKFRYKPKFDQCDVIPKTYVRGQPCNFENSLTFPNGNTKSSIKSNLASNYLSAKAFHPSRTVVVLNFLPEAETQVKSFVSRFGVIEICETIKDDDASSSIAVIQYMEVASALNALLALPDCKVRGSNLVIQLLWNGSYDYTEFESATHSFKECVDKRIVCVGNLPRDISHEFIYMKCSRYGYVEDIKIQQQNQEAFAYVVFRSPLSAAVATYCLRNSSRSNAALIMGYRPDGSPYLDGPVRVRPLDQYTLPLGEFDVQCIIERFKEYSKLKGLFVIMQRKLPLQYFFKPESSDYCVRIPTTQVKGVSLFLEILLFENSFVKKGEEINEDAYNSCNHKHLFRFSIDFGLNKPITPQNERLSKLNSLIRWNAFFVLDLQICYTIPIDGVTDLRLSPRIQGMNHVYSDIDSKALDSEPLTSLWFGLALRHTMYKMSFNDVNHKNKIRYIVASNLPFVRIIGSIDDLNSYQIPVHVYSDVQSTVKS